MTIFKNANSKMRSIFQNRISRKASETIEMVATSAIICFVVMNFLMILAYALQLNQISYAAKRIARGVEVSGYTSQYELEQEAASLIPNWDGIKPHNIHSSKTGTIQLRDDFTIYISGTYHLKLAQFGQNGMKGIEIGLPMNVKVDGQSEIYWKNMPMVKEGGENDR